MTEDDARTLSMRFIDTWPNGPKAYIWTNEFRTLDADRVSEAFRELRHTCPRISTAAFHAAYATTRPPQAATLELCRHCDGTGWIEAPPLTVGERTYSQVDRCHCNGGPT